MLPNLSVLFDHFAQGDDVVLTPLTVASVPSGDPIAEAWMTVKDSIFDGDPGIFQKHITPSFVAGVGQVTDTGVSGTGILRFDLTAANTVLLLAGHIYYFSIKVKTAAGKLGTPFAGAIITQPQATLQT